MTTTGNESAWLVVAIVFIILFVMMAGLNIHMHLARRRTLDEVRAINARHVRLQQEAKATAAASVKDGYQQRGNLYI